MIDEPTTKPRSSFWRELPILLGVAVVVAVLVRAFVLQTFFIPSESMENTLLIDDRVLVNKLVYDFRDPRRGEVIVFTSPVEWRTQQNEKDFIKRVIGVAGDHVFCCDPRGRITVNNKALDEQPYLYRDPSGRQDPPSERRFDIVVPPDRLWVMGDHRLRSDDSSEQFTDNRDIIEATIPVDSVIGRAFVLFWPLNRWDWLNVPDTFNDIPDPPG